MALADLKPVPLFDKIMSSSVSHFQSTQWNGIPTLTHDVLIN